MTQMKKTPTTICCTDELLFSNKEDFLGFEQKLTFIIFACKNQYLILWSIDRAGSSPVKTEKVN